MVKFGVNKFGERFNSFTNANNLRPFNTMFKHIVTIEILHDVLFQSICN